MSLGKAKRHSFRYICSSFQIRSRGFGFVFWCESEAGFDKITRSRRGVLCLSIIRGLYDNSIAACKTGTEQTVNLVPGSIRPAIKREKPVARKDKKRPLRNCGSAATNEMIDRRIYFYNHECNQLKTGEAPLARRLSA